MKALFNIFLFILFIFSPENEEMIALKCMVEMSSYRGEGAYFTISVIDNNESYLKY